MNFIMIGLLLREALDTGQTPCSFEHVSCHWTKTSH